MKKLVIIVISLFLGINITMGQKNISIDTQDGPMIIELQVVAELMSNTQIIWDSVPNGKQIIIMDITNTYKKGIVIKCMDINSSIKNARETFDSNVRITNINGDALIKKGHQIDLAPLLYILKYAPAYRYDNRTKKYCPIKSSNSNTIIIDGKVW